MKRTVAALAAVGTLTLVPAVAHAQDEGATPTTLKVETSTVERDVTVQTVESDEVETADNDTDDGDESDKTGLWGLLGLLGLAGLAGLKKRRDDSVDTTYTAGTVKGDTTPRGSTSTKP